MHQWKVGLLSLDYIFGSLDISFFYILCKYANSCELKHYWLMIQTNEKKSLTDICAQQMVEIKSLKALVKFSTLTISVGNFFLLFCYWTFFVWNVKFLGEYCLYSIVYLCESWSAWIFSSPDVWFKRIQFMLF